MPTIARIYTTEGQDRRCALTAGHHLLWQEVDERAHDHVGHPMRHLMVRIDDGSRKFRVHDGALGSPNFDSAPTAGIRRNEIIWVDRGFQPAINPRCRDREWRIHWTFDLRVGTGKIDNQPVCGLLHRELDAESRIGAGGVIGDAVAVAEIFEASFAVRQIHQRRAHQPFRVIHDLRHVADQPRRSHSAERAL